LAAFRNAHPGVELTLIEDDSARLIRRVREGEIAGALVGSAGPPPGLEVLTIVSEGLIAVVAPDHPLASSEETTVAAAAGYPLICMPVGTGVRAVFDRSCAAAGVHPDVALQASAPAAVADLARRGLGVAILTESMLAPQGPGLSGVRIADVPIPAVLALVWKSGANPALGRLVAFCRDAFGLGG
jgi:DNA-binding transcriptional LysR family regulator